MTLPKYEYHAEEKWTPKVGDKVWFVDMDNLLEGTNVGVFYFEENMKLDNNSFRTKDEAEAKMNEVLKVFGVER